MGTQNFDIRDEFARVLGLEGNAILQCAKRLTEDAQSSSQLEVAVKLLENTLTRGGKIIVTGVGKSGKVGQKIAATLCSTGSLAVFLHPTEGLHGDLGMIRPEDAVLALSHTGNTEELMRLVPVLKRMKVPVIGLTGNRTSLLATECDAWVDGYVENEACPHNLAPTVSTTLALALGDALAITLMQLRGFDAEAFARNHPGGSLGNRLHLRVEDLMHKGDAVATLPASANVDEVVVASSRKKLGAVLITENSKLIGIITDGDLRRALQHKERFFTLKASDIMTSKPVTVNPGLLAKAALELMENRPSQISVLPVTDQDDNWIGLLRLHDLARLF